VNLTKINRRGPLALFRMLFMIRRSVLPLFFLALTAVAGFAADVSGTWKGIMKSNEGGEFDAVLVLKADGNSLTGTFAQGRAGEKLNPPKAIDDGGKVADDQVTFSISYTNPNGVRKNNFSGKLEGSQLKLTSQFEGAKRKQEIVFDRQ
jgi:hypothetical protein